MTLLLDQRHVAAVERELGGFRAAASRLVVDVVTAQAHAPPPDEARLDASFEGETVRLHTPGIFAAVVDLARGVGRFTLVERADPSGRPQPFALYGALKALWPLLLCRAQGLLLHASAVATERGGALFVGRSGAGKSTLAAMFGEACVLNDELVALRLATRPPRLASTPFFGTPRAPRHHVEVEQRMGFFLEHADTCAVVELTGAQALSRLMPCVALPTRDAHTESAAFSLAARAVESARWALLRFPLDRDRVVDAVMRLL